MGFAITDDNESATLREPLCDCLNTRSWSVDSGDNKNYWWTGHTITLREPIVKTLSLVL